MSAWADPLLKEAEVKPGAAADLYYSRTTLQLQSCYGTTPIRPPPESDQVVGIHRPIVEAHPAVVDRVDLSGVAKSLQIKTGSFFKCRPSAYNGAWRQRIRQRDVDKASTRCEISPRAEGVAALGSRCGVADRRSVCGNARCQHSSASKN